MSESICEPLPSPSLPKKRSRDSSLTKIAVLAAAIKLFASRGYAGTSIRDIAALAEVNLGLVGRYFGTKEELFELALHESLDITPLFTTDREHFGNHASQIFFSYDENEVPLPLTMMILSAPDPAVRAISIDVLRGRVIAPMAAWLGGPDGVTKAMRITMLWSGFFSGWKLLRLNKMPGSEVAATQAWLAESTQMIIDRQ